MKNENNLIELKSKVFEGMEVEIIQDEKGDPIFELYSIGSALGYSRWTESKGRKYFKIEKSRINKIIKNGSISTLARIGKTFLTEDALYDFMLEARTSKCKSFRKWVTNEVLPSIRKHGAYVTDDKLEEMLTSPDTMIRVLQELKKEKDQRLQLESEVNLMLPKVEQFDGLMNSHSLLSMNEAAKAIGVGRNDLFKLLRNKSVLMTDNKNKQDHNVPYQMYIDRKYFTIIEREIMGETTSQTLVSTKGLEWISKKLNGKWKEDLVNIKKEIIEENKTN